MLGGRSVRSPSTRSATSRPAPRVPATSSSRLVRARAAGHRGAVRASWSRPRSRRSSPSACRPESRMAASAARVALRLVGRHEPGLRLDHDRADPVGDDVVQLARDAGAFLGRRRLLSRLALAVETASRWRRARRWRPTAQVPANRSAGAVRSVTVASSVRTAPTGSPTSATARPTTARSASACAATEYDGEERDRQQERDVRQAGRQGERDDGGHHDDDGEQRPPPAHGERAGHHGGGQRRLRALPGDGRRQPALELRDDEQRRGRQGVRLGGAEEAEAVGDPGHRDSARLYGRGRPCGIVPQDDPGSSRRFIPGWARGPTTGRPRGVRLRSSTVRRSPAMTAIAGLPDWGPRAAVAAPLLAVFGVAVGAPLYADDLSDAAARAASRSPRPSRWPPSSRSASRSSPCISSTPDGSARSGASRSSWRSPAPRWRPAARGTRCSPCRTWPRRRPPCSTPRPRARCSPAT